jgi:hypothetical protein
MKPELPTRVAASTKVLFQELNGECVLLNLDNDRYYGLDDVGTKMWQLLVEHGDVAVVVDRLLAEYGGEVDEQTLRNDLGELIAKLAAAGLLTVETAAK